MGIKININNAESIKSKMNSLCERTSFYKLRSTQIKGSGSTIDSISEMQSVIKEIHDSLKLLTSNTYTFIDSYMDIMKETDEKIANDISKGQ